MALARLVKNGAMMRMAARTMDRGLFARAAMAPYSSSSTRMWAAKEEADEPDMHPDFARQEHSTLESEDINAFLKETIDESSSKKMPLLFMKGTPSQPQCGFSYQVVRILHAEGVDFDAINVLDNPEVREGIKAYSEWPTIPQLYVGDEFVGGCDIVTEMHQSGELEQLLIDSDMKKADA
jgi:monothiol glutaredoxin